MWAWGCGSVVECKALILSTAKKETNQLTLKKNTPMYKIEYKDMHRSDTYQIQEKLFSLGRKTEKRKRTRREKCTKRFQLYL